VQSLSPVVRGTLLALSTLTIMAGATIAPGLPRMQQHFADVPDAGLLVRLVLTVVALSVALFSPIAGILADKFGRKPLLLFGLVLYVLAGTSGLYLETLPALLLGRVFLGIAVSSITTASSALIADYFSQETRAKFIALQSAFVSFGGVIFLPLGGLLADFGWHMPFAVYFAALAMLPFALLYLFEPAKAAPNSSGAHPIPRTIWLLYGFLFVQMVVFYQGPTQMPFFLQNQLRIAPSVSGYIVALFMLTQAVTALQYARVRQRFSEKQIAMLGFAMLGVGWGLFGFAQGLPAVLVGMVISGFGGGLLAPNFSAWIARLAPPEARGRVFGGVSTAVFLGQFVSPILAQPIVAASGLASVFAWGGGLALLAAVVLTFGVS
jgi:MFS family permease